jgi:hypothetical protein
MFAPEMFISRFEPNWIIARPAWICFALIVNAEAASHKTLFDSSTVTNAPGWQIVNDEVMGAYPPAVLA